MPNHTYAAINECVIILDTYEQKYLFISPAIEHILGITPMQLSKNQELWPGLISAGEQENIDSLTKKLLPNQSIELTYNITTPLQVTKRISDKKSLVIDEANGHKILLSTIKEQPPAAGAEDAKRREQFLNSLIDSQTNFLVRIDINGCFSFVNKQFLKTFGYKATELIGQHFSISTIPPELHLCEEAFINCVSNPGKIVKLLHKKPDTWGGIHDTDWEFIAITDDDGLVCEIQGIGQDVTAKLKIEQEVKEAAAKLDAFIESITDSFFIIDNEWRFVKVNSAFEKMTNTPREEMLGNVLWEVYPEIMDSGFGRAYYDLIEKGESVKFTEYFEPIGKWFSTSVYPSAEGVTVYVKDISHERRAQEEAHWTKTSLEALINNTHDHIWSVDKEMRYVYMNDAYIRETTYLTGVEPKAGEYSYRHEGYNEQIHREWTSYYAQALLGEQYTIINESIDRQTKNRVFFEVSFNPIYTQQNEIIGVGCFARDITQRLKIEEELINQNERLRNIASLSSHEIRRPVASMMGLISIMDKENFFNPDNEQIIQHIFTVSAEIDDVIRLIVDNAFTGHA